MFTISKTKSGATLIIGVLWIVRLASAQQPATFPTLANFTATASLFASESASLSGTIQDSNLPPYTATVNWGDGSDVQITSLPSGTTNFSFNHVYSNSIPTGSASDLCLVNFTVTANDGGTDVGFLSALYQDLLGRQIDSSAQASFLGLLTAGTNLQQVAADVTGSTEYEQDLATRSFEQYLHRAATGSEISLWTSYLGAPNTDESFFSELIGSLEYFVNRGQSNNTGFLNAVYYDLLDQPLDPGSQSLYLSQLNGGASRVSVALEVLTSQEYRNDLIQNSYQRFLQRLVDPMGQSFYLNFLRNGGTDEQMIDMIVGSTEYFDNRSGGTVSATALITVSNIAPVLGKPAITTPIPAGSSATLSAKIIETLQTDTFTLVVNWGDGSASQTNILGATNSFALTHLYAAPGADTVTMLLTDANGLTNFATVQVQVTGSLPPPTLSSLIISNGVPQLTGKGAVNSIFSVQATSDFLHWTAIGSATNDSSGNFSFSDATAAGIPLRFYRLSPP